MIPRGQPSDEGDWRSLEGSLRPFVERRVAPDDVDDVLQEIFLRLHRGAATLGDEQRFGAWAYRIARNAIVDHHRIRARHPLAPDASPPEAVASAPDDREAEAVIASYAAACVAGLPEPYREALTMTEIEGLSQKEAAGRLGITHSAMKSRVQRGRKRVRVAIERCCDVAVDARGRVIDYSPKPTRGCSC